MDWYAWGEEAFDARAARRTSRSSCRSATRRATGATSWSTSRSRTRRSPTLLNRDFVSIKVDREERPDVDRVYMSFVQATTGSGGWPMSVFLTPELKPFYGGTYFPPASRWGRPGSPICSASSRACGRSDRTRVEGAAAELLQRLRTVTGDRRRRAAESDSRDADALDVGVEQFQMSLRSPARRLRRRAEVPAPVRAAVPAARARAAAGRARRRRRC